MHVQSLAQSLVQRALKKPLLFWLSLCLENPHGQINDSGKALHGLTMHQALG